MKSVKAGRIGTPFRETVVEDNATVGDVLKALDIELSDKESVTVKDSVEYDDGDVVSLDTPAEDGATYVITSNVTSG